MRRWAFVLLLLLAGCTAPPETATEAAPAREDAAQAAREPLLLLAREPVHVASLDVSVSLSERWIKPLRGVDVRAEAPAGAQVAWFVALEEEEPRATSLEGDVFVLKASTPDHHDTDGARVPVRVAEMAPDGRARTAHFASAGRHTLAAEGAQLVVNAWPGAPAGPTQAFLVDEGESLRFEPRELDVAPGTRVLLWSQVARAVQVREVEYAAHVPLDGRDGHITAIDEGLYTLLAVAVQGSARGASGERFLVDFERPSDRLTAGPYEGSFLAPEAGLGAPRRLAFDAKHPLEELVVTFSASSLSPAPSSVVVTLLRGEEVLARGSSLTDDSLTLEDLPEGEYGLEVEGEHGASVSYRIGAEGRYRLPIPERLRESTT